MNLLEAKVKMKELMRQHNLIDYRFDWSNGKRTFGHCNNTKRLICLSRPLTLLNPFETVLKTMLHEIAHALTPGHNHDSVWQSKCVEIGGDGRRVKKNAITFERNYIGICPICTKVVAERFRLKRGMNTAWHIQCYETTGRKEYIQWRKK